jgi:hypothetical protein
MPTISMHEIVPVRDQVPKGTACIAERNAAVHTARCLHPKLICRTRHVNVSVILDPLVDRSLERRPPGNLEKGLGIRHLDGLTQVGFFVFTIRFAFGEHTF